MFNNHIRERLTPEQLDKYEKAHEKKNEADIYLKELRTLFSELKAKEKKYFKMLTNEEKTKAQYGSTLLTMIKQNLQLSKNKHPLVDKQIKYFRYHTKLFNTDNKNLIFIDPKNETRLTEGIAKLSSHTGSLHSIIRTAESEIRIANKHLQKITHHIDYIKQLRLPRKM